MSIIVGKRNFTESFSKMTVNDFSRDNIYRAKMIMNENTIQNRNISNQSYLLENARTLKQLFQHIDEKEILTVLDDCDNNIEIAMEILQRSAQPSMNAVVTEGRNVRKITASQDSKKAENPRAKKEEERKSEMIQEEEAPTTTLKAEEIQNLSANIVNTLQTLNSMDEAKEMIAQVIFQVINEAEQKDNGTISKLNKDKATLIKAFANQRIKAQAHEEKNELMSILKNSQEQEIAKLKTINYKLALKLRTLDSNNEENHNFDAYQESTTIL